MEQKHSFSSGKGRTDDLWYVDNYVLLKDYYDRTISRIAARCVRNGNIAMEEYKYYGYILDLLEEISETGEYIVAHQQLYSYVDKKIAGGINALKKNLQEFKTELQNNASPEMIKQDKDELKKFKEALGHQDKSVDPTAGAGMSMDQVIEKLMNNSDANGPKVNRPNQPQSGLQENQHLKNSQPQNQYRPNQPTQNSEKTPQEVK